MAVVERECQESVSGKARLSADGADLFRVLTPFRFDDGDRLVLMLKRDTGRWVSTDEALTYGRLAGDGDASDFPGGALGNAASGVLSGFGIEERGGERVIPVSDGRPGDALCAFARASIEVSGAQRLSREADRATGVGCGRGREAVRREKLDRSIRR